MHMWAEANPLSVTGKDSQLQFAINIWAGTVGDYIWAGTVGDYIGPHVLPENLNGVVYSRFLEDTLPLLL